ncbi:MAG: Crp/Fnr family transcriptional regulator [Bacteroidetes bacterium]|nr:Crp/Fnr family transcriptional regulator [Bacteroidota bacterium]
MEFDIKKYYFLSKPILDVLNLVEKKQLLDTSEKVNFEKGEILFTDGTYPKGFYQVLKGKVKIYQTDFNGNVQIVYIYTKNESFGFRPLLCSEKHPVTAQALENCTLLYIPKSEFNKLLSTSINFSNELLKNISYEYMVWVNRISAFGTKSLMSRLALALLILNEKYKPETILNKPIEITMSRGDLASYVGTSIEPLVRALKKLKVQKYIKSDRAKISIINREKLIELAQYI